MANHAHPISFNQFKCYNANILKQNKTLHNGIHTQIHTDLPWKPRREKSAFLELHSLSLFLSLHYIKCLQYNIRFQPTSETLIPIPELENHGPKNPIPWIAKPLTIIPPKTAQKNFSGAPPPNPRIRVADNGFRANTRKTDRGALAGYPPVTPLRRRHIARGASRARGQTPCKEYNINP